MLRKVLLFNIQFLIYLDFPPMVTNWIRQELHVYFCILVLN